MNKSNEQWKAELTPEQYAVLRQKETEAPFSGALLKNKETGMYTCAACHTEIFSSEHKFDSGSGWPSFFDVVEKGNVKLQEDLSHGMQRIKVLCSQCGSHLGHVFNDAPEQPTGMRFCVNSVALDFKQKDSK